MNINNILRQFVDFLNSSYDGLSNLTYNIEFNYRNIDLADKIEYGFYQFIWEMIVENQLCSVGEYMEPYGDGADFYSESSRAIYPEKVASKKVVLIVNEKYDLFSNKIISIQRFDFIKFVSYNGNEYFTDKPFDYVLCINDTGCHFIFKFEDVDFILVDL